MKLSGTIHFIGISGIGMSALARILLQRGFAVSGSSDRRTALTARLAEEGAEIFIGHDARNLGDAKTVVVSSAIDPANAELAAARAASLQVMYRGALLAQLMQGRRAIAIAGTHGKTTTTAMTACVLEASGLDPTVVVGGERVDTRSNAHDGRGEWFVAESDESDRSFLEMHPEIAIVTNVENDHVASDGEFAGLIVAFEKFLAGVPASGLALVGIDEPRAAALARMPRSARTRTFGFAESDVCAPGVTFASFGSRFDVIVDGKRAGEIRLPVPGAYNVQNALAAIAAGLAVGVPFETLAAALGAFRGVRRRFEILARSPRMTLVDDYAHHPTAVAAVLRAAREQFAHVRFGTVGLADVEDHLHYFARRTAVQVAFERRYRGGRGGEDIRACRGGDAGCERRGIVRMIGEQDQVGVERALGFFDRALAGAHVQKVGGR